MAAGPEVTERGRVVGLDRAPFAVFVVFGVPALIAVSAVLVWWAVALLGAAGLLVMTVPVRGKTGPRRLGEWFRFRVGRRGRAHMLGADTDIADIDVPAGVCGMVLGRSTLVAMIQLAPDLDLPTIIAERTLYTEDTIPVDALLQLLDQYGLGFDLDIVTTGRRTRAAGDYGVLYNQLIGSQPVVGERSTWLVVRLDQERNLTALRRRGPCEVSGPRALAGAAYRIANRLREYGITARVLPAGALAEATRSLHTGVELDSLREQWSRMATPVAGRFVRTYAIDWTRLAHEGLDDCWRWHNGRTTVVIALSSTRSRVRGLVRFIGPEPEVELPDYLRPLPGRQAIALLAGLPTAHSAHALPLDGVGDAELEHAAGLAIPIGPNGQIIGAIANRPRHTLALPLVDPVRYHPRSRSVDIRSTLPIAQQIVLRAMVVGADVTVHTARPHQWWPLVAAVADPRALRLAEGPADPGQPASLEVFDQVPERGSGAATVLTIGDPGTTPRRSADLSIEQVGESTVDIRIPMRTVRVDLIEPRGETRYFGSGTGPGPVGERNTSAVLAPPVQGN
ncbi:type VII secretion protein EccE [Nocardia tengchongensis]|uniref:type VII secretion protein EccE n=1 Tax=Nocardia tengchongensis TaxID=2055889 RepID=UPI0036860517